MQGRRQPAGLLLAAGGGTRYGMPKALVSDGGELWINRALGTLRDGGCAPLVVVIGAAAAEVRAKADLGGAIIVENTGWADGMGSSLRAGLAALGPTAAAAAVVMLVDTPGITADAVRTVATHTAPGALALATYRDEDGHPVLLGRDHWPGVVELATGDTGARAYLRNNPDTVIRVPCDRISDGTDVDSPAT
ncbi:nucleotidyltransferase family protein [Virgisporangium aurantiacum]|uniref:4-diphosphocytidyl-2C-methyl-D-erythritol synthase n=1 Tax=Virgisporangium aurantiacum TaxID=175570 RepID=A0A8J3ZAN9_9ACTN|nr:NTP transferase domain-containing protein [Virgisporangium aurantiacum]GIJ60494.1 4-diphosphocytidyl-2C-methyl-D-erythritol synthase [Virgisporangium aurantiacum]